MKDEFRLRYKTIPFATFCRNHKKNTLTENITSLSHKHREMELMAVLEGKARIYTDMQTYCVEKGDVVVISPYLMHNATIFADEDFKHYCLCFDLKILPDERLRENLEKGTVKVCRHIKGDTEISKELTECIVSAFNAHSEQKNGWELKVKGSMAVFFGVLLEHGLIEKTVKSSNSDDLCYRILDYIDKNYTQNITSSDAAEAFFVSKSYFCRIFKKNFGHCFQNYVCMYRTEKAKILLDTTDLPVSVISMQTGFNSFSYFSKVFKEFNGVSPTEYRTVK